MDEWEKCLICLSKWAYRPAKLVKNIRILVRFLWTFSTHAGTALITLLVTNDFWVQWVFPATSLQKIYIFYQNQQKSISAKVIFVATETSFCRFFQNTSSTDYEQAAHFPFYIKIQ